MRLIILLILSFFCAPIYLFAQTLELSIPGGELPSDLSEWEDHSDLMHISFTAPEGIKFSGAHIVFEVTEGVEHILASTRTKFSEQPIIKGTFKKKNFKFEDIIGTEIDVDPSLRSPSSLRGKLPGGLFSLCIYLVDSAGKQLGNVAQACTSFFVRDIEAPVLLAPANEATYNPKYPLAFSWTPANVLSQSVQYTLRLYPIYEDQSPEQAMAGSTAFYSSDEIYSTSFLYPSDAPKLSSLAKAKGFTWIVTQSDQKGKPIGKNYGRSIPSVFYLPKN